MTTTRTLVIARVLPMLSDTTMFRNNAETEKTMEKPKRKRQKLDHLNEEQKMNRRKLKNRVAAQSARDRKKVKLTELEVKVTNLAKQRNALLSCNEALAMKYESLEKENSELKKRLCELEKVNQSMVCRRCDGSIESAVLIHVPQPKAQESSPTSRSQTNQLMTPLIYLLMIMNAMQFLTFYKSVLKSYSPLILKSQNRHRRPTQPTDQWMVTTKANQSNPNRNLRWNTSETSSVLMVKTSKKL